MTLKPTHRATIGDAPLDTYKGHDIWLDASYTFAVVGPLLDELEGFGRGSTSMSGAKETIDAALRAKAQEAKTAEALSLAVVTEDGRELKLRGIHSGTGDLLFTPPQKNDPGSIYAPALWVADYLKRRIIVLAELKAIDRELNRVRVNFRSYGRIKPERYEEKVDELKAHYAGAVGEAAKRPAS